MSAHRLLLERLEGSVAELPTRPSIWFCHWIGREGRSFVAYGGLQAAREELMALRRARKDSVPCLLFGFQAVNRVREECGKRYPGSEQLLDWPGAAYLTYDATAELIQETAVRIAAGCASPLPEGLLTDLEGLLRLSGAIRHWLVNRRTVVEHALKDFKEATGRPSDLSPFYFCEQRGLSLEHQDDIRRLKAFHGASGLSPDAMIALRAASEAIQQFERDSRNFESAKTRLREAQDVIESWPALIGCIEAVLAALIRSIECTRVLSAVLEEAMCRGNDRQPRA